jgi:hypothetical protein
MSGDKLKALQVWEQVTKAVDKQLADFEKLFGFVESPFTDAIFRMQSEYTDAVAKNVGDASDWLNWYQFDNDMGAKGYEAGFGDDMREIKTLEDLLWLIEGK